MKIIIPMAGYGTRLLPHTLTVPKPLIKIAGKSIVTRLVEELAISYGKKIDEVAFIIGDFGKDVEDQLIALANSIGAKASIYYQNEKLGLAHALLCAKDSLQGNCFIAFGDTLFKSEMQVDLEKDCIIWVKKIKDPSAYGVVKLNNNGIVTAFVEKPKTFVSDLAIVGIYYFKDGAFLKNELQFLIDNNIMVNGEYATVVAFENMINKKFEFHTQIINEWLDCGNKDTLLHANERVLENKGSQTLASRNISIQNSVIIEPCFIGENAHINNSVIGPHMSIEKNTIILNCVLSKGIIQEYALLRNVISTNLIIGKKAEYTVNKTELSLGDFSKVTHY